MSKKEVKEGQIFLLLSWIWNSSYTSNQAYLPITIILRFLLELNHYIKYKGFEAASRLRTTILIKAEPFIYVNDWWVWYGCKVNAPKVLWKVYLQHALGIPMKWKQTQEVMFMIFKQVILTVENIRYRSNMNDGQYLKINIYPDHRNNSA